MADDLTLDDLWEALLSEEAPRIRQAWLTLTDEEASAVLEHLRRMTSEPDWADGQRQAAAAALAAISRLSE